MYIIFALIAGLLLGTLFFGGLFLTVKKMTTVKNPGLLFLSSMFLRVAIALTGFYFVSVGNWQRLLICLLGFIVARFIVIHFTKPAEEKQLQIKKEVIHEA